MPRWIDLDNPKIIKSGRDKFGNVLYAIPPDTPCADVVEVVRCKDCYAYQKEAELAEAACLDPKEYCALLRCEFGPDGFCSYGRRADNG